MQRPTDADGVRIYLFTKGKNRRSECFDCLVLLRTFQRQQRLLKRNMIIQTIRREDSPDRFQFARHGRALTGESPECA